MPTDTPFTRYINRTVEFTDAITKTEADACPSMRAKIIDIAIQDNLPIIWIDASPFRDFNKSKEIAEYYPFTGVTKELEKSNHLLKLSETVWGKRFYTEHTFIYFNDLAEMEACVKVLDDPQ
jgi:hypothetical protein